MRLRREEDNSGSQRGWVPSKPLITGRWTFASLERESVDIWQDTRAGRVKEIAGLLSGLESRHFRSVNVKAS